MAATTLTPTSAIETPKLLKKASTTDVKNAMTPTPTSYGCAHIKALLQAARPQATDQYSRIIQSLQKEGNVSDRTHKSSSGAETSSQVTYLCLQCPNVSNSHERHRKDHPFSIESHAGFLYCHDCRDFVYDPYFEETRTAKTTRKRKHAALQPEERRLVSTNTAITPCGGTGLRGLYNMGQTCFMSVILQSLIHNPLIRSYYLSEGHKSADCEREACTSCALDDIFTDCFGFEKHEGYGAVHMLQGCWKGGGGLAGYSQQDAHEYLGFILNSLHTANVDDNNNDDDGEEEAAEKKKKKDSAKDCDCIIHQTFGGLLRSTVTCTKCKNMTSTSDPFMDVSLDIRSAGVTIKKKKLSMINGTTTVKEALPMDLTECLDRFTSAETTDDYNCRKCNSAQEARKKLSLHRLPPVMPVHLKRFSHSKTLKESSKVDTKVRFPLTLDLAPYTTPPKKPKPGSASAVANGHKAAAAAAAEGDDADKMLADYGLSEPVYELSSVVVHKGKIDNGHYISYSKQGTEWFRFDDSMVVQVDEKEVLGAEAYMLFYVARGFDI